MLSMGSQLALDIMVERIHPFESKLTPAQSSVSGIVIEKGYTQI
jgi:hypothetical protein